MGGFAVSDEMLQNRLTWDYVFPGQPRACSMEAGYGEALPADGHM